MDLNLIQQKNKQTKKMHCEMLKIPFLLIYVVELDWHRFPPCSRQNSDQQFTQQILSRERTAEQILFLLLPHCHCLYSVFLSVCSQ